MQFIDQFFQGFYVFLLSHIERCKGQFGRYHRICRSVMPFTNLKIEVVGPVIQPAPLGLGVGEKRR